MTKAELEKRVKELEAENLELREAEREQQRTLEDGGVELHMNEDDCGDRTVGAYTLLIPDGSLEMDGGEMISATRLLLLGCEALGIDLYEEGD